MLHSISRIALFVVLVCPSLAQAETVDVAAGIFAVLQPHESRFDDSNVIVIEGRDAILIVDAPTSSSTIEERQ